MNQPVRLCRHPNDRMEFGELRIRKPQVTRGRGVGADAIIAALRHRHRNIDELLGEHIELAVRTEDAFHLCPGLLQQLRIVGQHPPNIIHEIGIAGGTNIGEYRRGPLG